MTLLLLSTSSSLKLRLNNQLLMLNITKMSLPVMLKSPVPPIAEIPTPPPRLSVSKLSSTLKAFSLMLRTSSLRPLLILLSLPRLSKTVPP